jgi:hypothetical protein
MKILGVEVAVRDPLGVTGTGKDDVARRYRPYLPGAVITGRGQNLLTRMHGDAEIFVHNSDYHYHQHLMLYSNREQRKTTKKTLWSGIAEEKRRNIVWKSGRKNF